MCPRQSFTNWPAGLIPITRSGRLRSIGRPRGKGRGGSPEPPRGEIIPKSTIEKPPSAELKPNQKDQDTLPPYEVLDQDLQLYVEDNLSARDIISHGFDEKTVRWVQRRVDLNEYKREQAAPGLKVTSRAFGIGRKMPIAQKYVD